MAPVEIKLEHWYTLSIWGQDANSLKVIFVSLGTKVIINRHLRLKTSELVQIWLQGILDCL